MGGHGTETEIKLAISDLARVRRQLRRLGFGVRHRRGFEQNTLFDSRAGMLRRRGCMLRLRSVRNTHWLTFKGPAQGSRKYKIRQELETKLADARVTGTILSRLGFEPVFHYEKYRTVLVGAGRWRGGEVMLDETPIGNFLELEGKPFWIRQLARALDVSPSEFITKDYAALYTDWCRRHGRPKGHMLFGRPAASRLDRS